MPRRKHTGANLLTMEELMVTLNMTEAEIMVLVGNGIPHIRRDEPGKGVYYLFPDREVLALVSPLPANRAPVLDPDPVIEDEEDEPIEAVFPEKRPAPSMTATAPPATTKPVTKPPAKTGKTPEKTSTKTSTKPKK